MRVLIAEDDAVSRRILETYLRNWGYEVVTTCDGEEAWGALSEPDAPHLVILDIMMPGIDGLEICRRIRQQSRAITSHIILLTAKHAPVRSSKELKPAPTIISPNLTIVTNCARGYRSACAFSNCRPG